jgi:vacuolar-type H+-ATPase subunit H
MLRAVGTVFALVVFAGGLLADDPKAKAKPDKTGGKEMTATVLKVDPEKNTIRVRTRDGKQTDLMIDDETQFIGPRGGASKDGIKDDRLRVGAQLKVVMDGKSVKEIHLPYRNVRERLQDKKEEAKEIGGKARETAKKLGEKAKEEAKEIGGKAKEAAKKLGEKAKELEGKVKDSSTKDK